jgi:DNA-binding SARP family transcriptional activator
MQGNVLVRLLGPVDLVVDGRPVPLGSRHQRALLAALAMSVAHAVPTDRLRAVLWGDRPPRSANGSLHTYASRLRGLIGSDAVERADHSYLLAIEPDCVDAVRFERLVRDAAEAPEPGIRSDRCRRALALWRGEAFGDLADDDAFRLEALRLAELRVTAMELALAAEIELGRHETAVAELEIAVEEHPYHEHLWHLLIDALSRDGRRVEALRACARLRATLAGAGLEAGTALEQLERQILTGDLATSSEPSDAGTAG